MGTALGNQVIVGTDTENGALGIFFPSDGQLTTPYCEANDLITYKDVVTGEKKGGYFDDKRRVRAQKFRGERSEGLWMPLSSLNWTDYDVSQLREGDKITELHGFLICNKYYTPATLKAMKTSRGRPKRGATLY
ncbi:MAG: hypothetical protein ACREQ3_15070, partial [Candidatus Binatia bacterium]